jgi:bifunctional non-homologous end joining protein LigD
VAEKLEEYRRKRDFAATAEPAGGEDRVGEGPRFVVHEHHARRLHWDLRLERDGVLVSWAVPNGIPQDPKDNRKAIHTEDHPLEYIDFAGEIPKGSYGAGSMRIWDAGIYECHKFEPKKVIVTFNGERLRGKYALFQTAGDEKDWMIHRMDPPADPGRAPMPERIVPMLAKPGKLPKREEDYGFEVKWDGIRAIVYSRPGDFRIEGRSLADMTAQYPELRGLGRALGSHEAVLDGEIVAFGEDGRPSFELLQRRMHLTGDAQVKRRSKELPATYIAFDLLWLDGHSLMELPYEERRERLAELDLDGASWRTPPHHPGEGTVLLGAAAEQGLEGVVAKRLDSAYEPGRRSGAWVKVKNKRRAEFVIGGWLPGEGKRTNRIGALLVGVYDAGGALRFAGRVGSGFTERELDYLAARLEPLRRPKTPFEGRRPPRGAVHVEPERVCEVEFTEMTREGILRHPVYKGLCDLDPQDVVAGSDRDLEPPFAAGETPSAADLAIGPLRELPGGAVEATVDGRTIRISNFNKVLYPRTGFTKGDLVDYFVRVSPVLLPHLHGRPLTLKRYPDGVEGQHFYEKQCPSHRPEWVQTAAIWSRHNNRNIDFCLANDLPTLVWAGNLADIELHTSLSLADEIERPTMMVFDLDPGEPADIVDCCRVGLWLRDLFGDLGLETFAKTSGSKGLQVYLPLNTPDVTYDDAKPFARAVAELLQKQHPDDVVSRMTKSLRPGKVLVDWSQNDEHKTTVCVYSLRAKERPTVSTPVTWKEVEQALRREDPERLVFDSEELLRRVEAQGDLFAPVLALKQQLPNLGDPG